VLTGSRLAVTSDVSANLLDVVLDLHLKAGVRTLRVPMWAATRGNSGTGLDEEPLAGFVTLTKGGGIPAVATQRNA